MSSLESIIHERLKKLAYLRDEGINPFPESAEFSHTIAESERAFDTLAKENNMVTLGGRVTTFRNQGAIIFFNFTDGTGVFQGMLRQDEVGKSTLQFFESAVDVGDFIELDGMLTKTKRGEKTILVTSWRMLAKSLRPLPEKWHGLKDTEERFRKRYLDILMNEEVRERFLTRAKILASLRRFLEDDGFIEVETPVLQHLAGGATAKPFQTHYNALDSDMFLRIAPELYLKELLVGGFPKVFEMGRNFRNEGIDVTHNPEFTMLEFYEAYSDAKRQQEKVESLVRAMVEAVYGGTHFTYDGQDINAEEPFRRASLYDLLKEHTDIIDPTALGRAEYVEYAEKHRISTAPSDSREKIIDTIYKKIVKPKLFQPTFIIDYPTAFSPFAKRQEENPDLIARFQLVIGGLEIVNAFSELNDPEEQRRRYGAEEKKRAKGEMDVSPADEAYIEAMEYGMPPAGGVGLGVDRLVMLLTDAQNIREVILFPTLKQKNE